MIQTRMRIIWTQCKERRNEDLFLILSTNLSQPRQRFLLLNRTKKEKAEFKHKKHCNILQKRSKIFKTAFMKKN